MKKLQLKNILVPIDFSEMSIRTIATAKHLARRFGSVVHLVNFHEFSYPAGFFVPAAPIPVMPMPYLEEERKGAARRLKILAKEYGLTGTCRAEVGGPVFDEICSVAREISADLIVTSTHGRTGLKHAFLGSTAERLVQHSPCPVLVAREKETNAVHVAIDTILVPVDFSKCSLAGLAYAIQFAEKVAAKIVLLHVVDIGPLLTADGYAMYDLTKYQKMASADAERQMRRLVRSTKFGGVKFKSVFVIAPSVTGICEEAKNEKADLIITATHGRTGLKHVLIGSTAEVVVRHAPCPVLVVPSHPEIRAARLASQKVKGRRPATKRPSSKPKARPGSSSLPARSSIKSRGQAFPERRKTNKFRESHLSR